MNRTIILFSLLTAGILATSGCSSSAGDTSSGSADSTSAVSRDVFAMDTFMTLKAYGENAPEALDSAVLRIEELEHELSVTDADSDIHKINTSGGNAVEVSEDTMNILNKAVSVSSDTGGALNICIYPVLKAWGFTADEYRIPTDSELDALLMNTDMSEVMLSGNSAAIPADYSIDLGALAKGYASDEITELLRENGVTSAIISLGGNVQSLGNKPDGTEWKVSVRDPFAPDSDMCIVSIGEKAVITSGNYERYFVGEDGKRYWHIIDPADGHPADNGLVSVTVIGSSGMECDALSTSLFVMGYPEAVEFWRKDPHYDLILVTDEGRIYYTPGISDSFTNISSMPAEMISEE